MPGDLITIQRYCCLNGPRSNGCVKKILEHRIDSSFLLKYLKK
jgi:hypothetical protein